MFEFHGWATIRIDTEHTAEFTTIGYGPVFEAIKRLRAAINEAHDEFSLLELRQAGSGETVLLAHGLRNHRFQPVIDLFRWLAAELPASYGLLYIHDDEAMGQENEFRAWRLARGRLDDLADPFLSPYIPTVEPPFDG